MRQKWFEIWRRYYDHLGTGLKSDCRRRLEFRSAHLCQDDRPRALLLRPRILRALRDPGHQRSHFNDDNDHLFRVLSEAHFSGVSPPSFAIWSKHFLMFQNVCTSFCECPRNVFNSTNETYFTSLILSSTIAGLASLNLEKLNDFEKTIPRSLMNGSADLR